MLSKRGAYQRVKAVLNLVNSVPGFHCTAIDTEESFIIEIAKLPAALAPVIQSDPIEYKKSKHQVPRSFEEPKDPKPNVEQIFWSRQNES